MTEHTHSDEFARLWAEWLKTTDGSGYEAGWGDLWNRLKAAQGRIWCLNRMVHDRDERIKGLEMERDTARLDHTAAEGRYAAARAEVERLGAGSPPVFSEEEWAAIREKKDGEPA